MAGAAPLGENTPRPLDFDASPWLPTYAWWPDPAEYSATVVLSPYHAAVQRRTEFAFRLRCYSGSREPLWEYDVGRLSFGEDRAICLPDVGAPPPPSPHGGILEVHALRLDRRPRRGAGYIGMWVDARGADGGGYSIPTIPIRGAKKAIGRDDLQVVPGVVASREDETEVLVLNPIDQASEVRLVAASPDGLVAESDQFEVAAWSAWRGDLSRHIPGLRRLLAPTGGMGSLAVYSSHKILPYFAYRRGDRPITCYDHAAPIFAAPDGGG